MALDMAYQVEIVDTALLLRASSIAVAMAMDPVRPQTNGPISSLCLNNPLGRVDASDCRTTQQLQFGNPELNHYIALDTWTGFQWNSTVSALQKRGLESSLQWQGLTRAVPVQLFNLSLFLADNLNDPVESRRIRSVSNAVFSSILDLIANCTLLDDSTDDNITSSSSPTPGSPPPASRPPPMLNAYSLSGTV
jgi:hypothetical protein